MNRSRLPIMLILALLLLAVSPLLAAAPQPGDARPACGVQIGVAAQTMSLLEPARIDAAAPPAGFTLQLIGQCCTNNDAALCPPVAGYSTAHCAFPMCGGGQLSCVYQ
jgi:hypothetical protein